MCASARGLILLLGLTLLGSGCGGPAVDLKQGLQIDVVGSGWFDSGIVEGKNKLVPTVSFTVKNVSDQKLVSLQMMASFFRVSDTSSEWGNSLLNVAGSEGLASGATTPTLTLRSPLGYTGTEPRADMLKNAKFVDAMVKLVAKYAATQWVHVREVPIERNLITP
ncbi:MAG: hypothetical protein Q7J25_05530 [Vicinamibacterales bacterium]|nr:hypothetical protein [Vicinamibacterales bacterium]